MDRKFRFVEEIAPRRNDFCAFLQPFPETALRRHHADQLLCVRAETVALHPLCLKERVEPETLRSEAAARNLAHRRTILGRRIKRERPVGKCFAIMDQGQSNMRLYTERPRVTPENTRQVGTEGPQESVPRPQHAAVGQHAIIGEHRRRDRAAPRAPEQAVLASPTAHTCLYARQRPPQRCPQSLWLQRLVQRPPRAPRLDGHRHVGLVDLQDARHPPHIDDQRPGFGRDIARRVAHAPAARDNRKPCRRGSTYPRRQLVNIARPEHGKRRWPLGEHILCIERAFRWIGNQRIGRELIKETGLGARCHQARLSFAGLSSGYRPSVSSNAPPIPNITEAAISIASYPPVASRTAP